MFKDLFRDPALKYVCSAEGDPPPAEGSGGAPAPAATPPQPDAVATPPDGGDIAAKPGDGWTPEAYQKQLNSEVARRKALESDNARLRALEQENQRLRELADAAARRSDPAAAPPTPAPAPTPAPTPAPASDDARVNARVEEELLKRQVQDLQANIQANYADKWQAVLANFERVGGIPPDVMTQLLATDDPAYVLTTLGTNPSQIQDVLDLPPAKRQAALIKIGLAKGSAGAPPAPKPSGAPPPPEPVGARGSGGAPPTDNIYDPDLSDDDWYAIRQRQKRESEGRVWSFGGNRGRAA